MPINKIPASSNLVCRIQNACTSLFKGIQLYLVNRKVLLLLKSDFICRLVVVSDLLIAKITKIFDF